jgi:hypothetical protein
MTRAYFDRFDAYNKDLLKRCGEDAKREHYRKNTTIERLF